MSTSVLPTDETLTEGEVYSIPVGGATTSDVLSWEGVVSAVSAWHGRLRPVRVRLHGFSPNAAMMETIERLYSLTELQSGWNSYGARPIRPDVIRHVVQWIPRLIQSTTPRPAVVPRVNGGLQLEWHCKGVDLEIYVDSPKEIRFAAENLISTEAAQGPLSGNEELLGTWIARISD